jgi:hypothetical protein
MQITEGLRLEDKDISLLWKMNKKEVIKTIKSVYKSYFYGKQLETIILNGIKVTHLLPVFNKNNELIKVNCTVEETPEWQPENIIKNFQLIAAKIQIGTLIENQTENRIPKWMKWQNESIEIQLVLVEGSEFDPYSFRCNLQITCN